MSTKLTTLDQLRMAAAKAKAEADAINTSLAGLSIPTKVSDLTNDSGFQTATQVSTAVSTAISQSGHAHFEKVDSVPAADAAQENVMYLVMNNTTGYYDIYAKVSGSVVRLDDTTVDLTNYVQKEDGKALSTNDYTTDEKNKLADLTYATDAEVTAMLNEVYGTTA